MLCLGGSMTHQQAERRRRQITTEIAMLGFCLPGSFVEQHRTCSSPGCHCHRDPAHLHGPYRTWTRKVAGKTVSQSLSQEQFERYRPWIDNARRLHELISELEQISAAVIADHEAWPVPPVPPPDGRREHKG